MKKPFWVIIFMLYFLSTNINTMYAQKKDKSDYFAISLYGGAFNGQTQMYESNEVVNSISAEVEYFKLDNLSFYLQGLYKFEGSYYGHQHPYPPPPPPPSAPDNTDEKNMYNPSMSILNISFGGRYYLRNKDVNPFVQLGINHLTYFNEGHGYRPDTLDYTGDYRRRGGYSDLNLAIDPGIGLSVQLSDKFNAELKYDLLIGITNSEKDFTGYSVLCGLKYNF